MRRFLTIFGSAVVDGIFACGDLTTVPYKQIIVSMGEGAEASLAAFDYLLITSTPVADDARKAA